MFLWEVRTQDLVAQSIPRTCKTWVSALGVAGRAVVTGSREALNVGLRIVGTAPIWSNSATSCGVGSDGYRFHHQATPRKVVSEEVRAAIVRSRRARPGRLLLRELRRESYAPGMVLALVRVAAIHKCGVQPQLCQSHATIKGAAPQAIETQNLRHQRHRGRRPRQ